MKSHNKIIICSILCLTLFSACKESAQQTAGVKYKTLTVEKSDRILENEYTASVQGRQFVEIRPQVSGIITDICINEGDAVKKGQTLFIIDQVPYKAALETATANVKSAESQLATAKLDAESREELYKANVVSEYDLQTARNTLAAAEAALAQAKAEEINARNSLSYTEVKSPVDGSASMIPYRVGALVSSSIAQPLVTVSDDAQVYIYFSMSENQIIDLIQHYGSLRKAIEQMPEIEFRLSNGTLYGHAGRVDAISGTVDASTGAVSLRATFDNPEKLLRNGGNGTVIVPTALTDCIVIPQSSTYEIQDKKFVYKVIDGKTESFPIEVFRLNNGTEYVVESGLEVGDIIIAEGAGLLRDGIAVDIENSEVMNAGDDTVAGSAAQDSAAVGITE